MSEPPSAEPPAAGAADESAPSTPAPKQSDQVEQQDFVNPTLGIIQSLSRKTSTSAISTVSREDTPPPLPPRPRNISLLDSRPPTSHSTAPTRPQLVSKATTQLSYADSHLHENESREPSPEPRPSKARRFFGLNIGSSHPTSDVEDSASVRSVAPTLEGGLEAESMLGEVTGTQEKSLLQSLGHSFADRESETLFPPDAEFEAAFNTEFEDIEEFQADGSNEGQRLCLYVGVVCADSMNRRCYATMARQTEALSHPFERGEAHIQSTW